MALQKFKYCTPNMTMKILCVQLVQGKRFFVRSKITFNLGEFSNCQQQLCTLHRVSFTNTYCYLTNVEKASVLSDV